MTRHCDRTLRAWTMALVAACAGAASAETPIRFDTADTKAKGPVSLFESIREATKGAELPAVAAAKEVATPAKAGGAKQALQLPPGVKEDPAFWGSDGRWCPDGQAYRGGPCDNTWGGDRDRYGRDPDYRTPRRSPYDDPNWYRRDPYSRDPYYRRDPYSRDPYYRDPYYRGPQRGPTRDPWRDPPTRRGWRR